MTPDSAPKRKYSVPISLWLVEQVHRRRNCATLFSLGVRLVTKLVTTYKITSFLNFAKSRGEVKIVQMAAF